MLCLTATWFVSSAGGELLDCGVAGWKIVASNGSQDPKQGLQRTRKMILELKILVFYSLVVFSSVCPTPTSTRTSFEKNRWNH